MRDAAVHGAAVVHHLPTPKQQARQAQKKRSTKGYRYRNIRKHPLFEGAPGPWLMRQSDEHLRGLVATHKRERRRHLSLVQ